MRILLVHNFYQQAGGEDAVVRNELELLRNKGHEVLLHQKHNDEIATFADKVRTSFRATYNQSAREELEITLAKFKPEIVHVHNIFPQFSPSIFDACISTCTPTVMTLHNFRILCPTAFLYHDERIREKSLKGPCWWTIPKRVYRNSFLGTAAVARMVEWHKRKGTWKSKVTRFIALTEFARCKFIEGGLPADRILVKGNAASPLEPLSTSTIGREGAIFVGRLSEEKGIRTLVAAWNGIDAPLKIVGDGPLMDWVRQNASGNVKILGRLSPPQVQAELLASRFLILPSAWYEMFPMVILEAFASGLPALVSDLPVLKEIVQAGVTGQHFGVNDPISLKNAAEAMLNNPTKLVKMGEQARRIFFEKYTAESNYENLIAIYKEVITATPDSPFRKIGA